MDTSYLGMILIGLVVAACGIPNLKGNISTIHWYNRSRVSEKDVPKYGRMMGAGTVVIGLSIAVAGLLQLFTASGAADIIALAGVAAGLALMLWAQFKYNGGIF